MKFLEVQQHGRNKNIALSRLKLRSERKLW